MMMTEKRCSHEFERSWVTECYLFWECKKCKAQEIEHFAEMDDESWEWVKFHFRESK